jgi:hypothetical protein
MNIVQTDKQTNLNEKVVCLVATTGMIDIETVADRDARMAFALLTIVGVVGREELEYVALLHVRFEFGKVVVAC